MWYAYSGPEKGIEEGRSNVNYLAKKEKRKRKRKKKLLVNEKKTD
jgi:hypothetical protein